MTGGEIVAWSTQLGSTVPLKALLYLTNVVFCKNLNSNGYRWDLCPAVYHSAHHFLLPIFLPSLSMLAACSLLMAALGWWVLAIFLWNETCLWALNFPLPPPSPFLSLLPSRYHCHCHTAAVCGCGLSHLWWCICESPLLLMATRPAPGLSGLNLNVAASSELPVFSTLGAWGAWARSCWGLLAFLWNKTWPELTPSVLGWNWHLGCSKGLVPLHILLNWSWKERRRQEVAESKATKNRSWVPSEFGQFSLLQSVAIKHVSAGRPFLPAKPHKGNPHGEGHTCWRPWGDRGLHWTGWAAC